MIANPMFNLPIDTDPQQDEGGFAAHVVVRSSSR
jgi:hypothetical protein